MAQSLQWQSSGQQASNAFHPRSNALDFERSNFYRITVRDREGKISDREARAVSLVRTGIWTEFFLWYKPESRIQASEFRIAGFRQSEFFSF
jgi:hypothetical protein